MPDSQPRFRMPAEWEPHERCWMAWPCRPESWQNGLGEARKAFAAVVRAVARHEPVTLMVRAEDLDDARHLTGGAAELVTAELDDSWTRDIGPTFVVDGAGGLAGVDWGFNAWGLAYEGFARDARLARHILHLAGAHRIVGPQILEGGSIHVDGEGTLVTTEQCLLDPQRNPHLSKADIEANLRDCLGVETVIWLPRGLTNDETLGHVDNHLLLCRARTRAAARNLGCRRSGLSHPGRGAGCAGWCQRCPGPAPPGDGASRAAATPRPQGSGHGAILRQLLPSQWGSDHAGLRPFDRRCGRTPSRVGVSGPGGGDRAGRRHRGRGRQHPLHHATATAAVGAGPSRNGPAPTCLILSRPAKRPSRRACPELAEGTAGACHASRRS